MPPHSQYVVAIPTYNRADVIATKTLDTLMRGGVKKSRIYIFVANRVQERAYHDAVPASMYGHIIVGKLGIAKQRAFIADYFPEGQYVVSMDDDVEDLLVMKNATTLRPLSNLDAFFTQAYVKLRDENLFIWGVYPVRNPFFMKKVVTTDLKFLIGVTFGYITRHLRALRPSPKSESKEDYEQSILYYLMDGGVMRYNCVTPKTKFNAAGGLGTDRFSRNQSAANYLSARYPDLMTPFYRDNGTPEVRMSRRPRFDVA